MTASSELSPIRSLILARLLAAGEKGESISKIAKDLEPLLEHRWSGAALAEMVDGARAALEAASLVACLPGKTRRAVPKVALTADGRRQGLEFLGVETLRPKTTWGMIRKTYLPARMLGLPASGDAAFKALSSDPGFKAVLLRDCFQLATALTPKLDAAIDALTWKLIGFENEARKFDVKAVKTAVLNRALGDGRATEFKKAATQLVAQHTQARRDDTKELRDVVVRRWIDREIEDGSKNLEPRGIPATTGCAEVAVNHKPLKLHTITRRAEAAVNHKPLELHTLAERVKAAARACPTGRYGDHKVFIAHVWRMLQADPDFAAMDLSTFKERLAAANNSRLLDLSRADLVQAMDPEDVRLSEVRYLNATFHFIRI
jgi:hypothetical protein